MNKHNYVLTEEEKKIFENHFIHDGHMGKQNFEEFTNNLISHYLGQPFNLKNREDRERHKDYSINLIWDKDTKTTALMHCFNHPKFSVSNTKLKHYFIFNGDVNETNINGQSAIMILAKNPKINFTLPDVLEKNDNFELLLLDENNKTVHMHFFDTINRETFHPNTAPKRKYGDIYMAFFTRITNLNDILAHWMKEDIPKTKEQEIYVGEKIALAAEIIREVASDKEFLKYYKNYGILEDAKNLNSIGTMLQLNATMTVNEQNNRKFKV